METQSEDELARSIQSIRVTRRWVLRVLAILFLLSGGFVGLFIHFVSHNEYESWMMVALIFCLLNLIGFALVVRYLNDTLTWLKEQQTLQQTALPEENVWPPAPERPAITRLQE